MFNEDLHIVKEEYRLSMKRLYTNKVKLSLEDSAMFLIWDMQNGKCEYLRLANPDILRGDE